MPTYMIKLRDQNAFAQICQHLTSSKKQYRALQSIRAVSVNVDSNQELDALSQAVPIARIYADPTVALIQDIAVEEKQVALPARTPWGVRNIGARYRKIPQRYARPKVAILDTGLVKHPALQLSKKYANFSSESKRRDLSGHGTHLAGTIGGFATSKKEQFHGVFPQLSLYSVKVFSKEGTAPLSSIIAALEWCMRHKMNIVNMSFGLNRSHPLLHEAIQAAAEAGLIMVAPSGNNGQPGLSYPARYPQVISVGSVNIRKEVSTFSQFGMNLDVVAPGEEITSTWLQEKYKTMSGTSMAAAHTSGALAIMLSMQPEISSLEARQLLIQTTEKLQTSNMLQGNGLVSVRNIIDQIKQ